MPWCDTCAKYRAPSAMRPDGTCPSCGRDLETPDPVGMGGGDPSTEVEVDEKVPWHFKLMVVALVVYLVYRCYAIFT